MLYRTAHHSAELELELTRRNIPYVKFGGLKFLEAAHVKDLLAILRFAENPRDRVSGFRVLQLMPGIGEVTAEDILDQLETMAGAASLAEVRVPPRAAEQWAAFVQLFELLQRGTDGWPAEIEAVRLWMSRISSGDTRTRRCAPATSCSSCGSPTASPRA